MSGTALLRTMSITGCSYNGGAGGGLHCSGQCPQRGAHTTGGAGDCIAQDDVHKRVLIQRGWCLQVSLSMGACTSTFFTGITK